MIQPTDKPPPTGLSLMPHFVCRGESQAGDYGG